MLRVTRGVIVLLFVASAGCGNDEAGAPKIESFRAGPDVIVAGSSSSLSWRVTGATTIAIEPGIGAVAATSVDVTPLGNTTYTLFATNAAGTSTATATVTVLSPPTIASFTASPSTIFAGGSVNLAWNVTGADTLSIDNGVGIVTGDTVTVHPGQTSIYTLTAANRAAAVTATVTVTVTVQPLPWPVKTPPSISTFTATPAVAAGAGAVLEWIVSGTGAPNLRIDPVVGTVAFPSGSVTVAPAATTTYSLTASNMAGSTRAQATVFVPEPLCGSAAGVYAGYTPYPAATGQRIVLVDLDGDPSPDLAVLRHQDVAGGPGWTAIDLFSGRPDGTFVANGELTVAAFATALAAGDANGDGRTDLAVASYAYDAATYSYVTVVSVFTSDRMGGFSSPTVYPTAGFVRALGLTDLDGDSILDLVALEDSSSAVRFFPGRGDGTFGPGVDHATGSYPFVMATGDLDRDGRPDLVLAFGSRVDVQLGDGAGGVRGGGSYAFDAGSITPVTTAIAVADLDGDRAPDLILATAGPQTVSGTAGFSADDAVVVLRNAGDGTFLPAQTYAVGLGPSSVVVADVDGDGSLDLVVTGVFGVLSVLRGDGHGAFAPAVLYPAPARTYAAVAGDFDQDGRPDLALLGQAGFSIHLNGCTAVPVAR